MRALDPELVERRAEKARVALDRVAEVPRSLGPTEAGHVERDAARERRHAAEQVVPVAPGPGIPVHEHDRLARVRVADRGHRGG